MYTYHSKMIEMREELNREMEGEKGYTQVENGESRDPNEKDDNNKGDNNYKVKGTLDTHVLVSELVFLSCVAHSNLFRQS